MNSRVSGQGALSERGPGGGSCFKLFPLIYKDEAGGVEEYCMDRINYGILVRVGLEVVTVTISSHHTFIFVCICRG